MQPIQIEAILKGKTMIQKRRWFYEFIGRLYCFVFGHPNSMKLYDQHAQVRPTSAGGYFTVCYCMNCHELYWRENPTDQPLQPLAIDKVKPVPKSQDDPQGALQRKKDEEKRLVSPGVSVYEHDDSKIGVKNIALATPVSERKGFETTEMKRKRLEGEVHVSYIEHVQDGHAAYPQESFNAEVARKLKETPQIVNKDVEKALRSRASKKRFRRRKKRQEEQRQRQRQRQRQLDRNVKRDAAIRKKMGLQPLRTDGLTEKQFDKFIDKTFPHTRKEQKQ